MIENLTTINENINTSLILINEICEDIDNNNINFNSIIALIDNLSKLAGLIVSTDNTSISIEEYNEKLTLALDAFKNGDFALFGEILQYELSPLLDYWMESIN